MSSKVEIEIFGRKALVPVEHASKIILKNQLVGRAQLLQKRLDSMKNAVGVSAERADMTIELNRVMAKIIQLNRAIPPCVIFL